MKLFRVFSAVFTCCLMLSSHSVLAQGSPISCSWSLITSNSGSWGANVTVECLHGATQIATKYMEYRGSPSTMTVCNLSVASGYVNQGTCQNTSFYTSTSSSSSSSGGSSSGASCNSGAVFGTSCKYYTGVYGSVHLTPGPNATARAAVCGDASCGVATENMGYNSECRPGSRYQQYDNPIIEWSCQ